MYGTKIEPHDWEPVDTHEECRMLAWFVALQFHSLLCFSFSSVLLYGNFTTRKVLERTKIWSCIPTEPETEIDCAGEG
jgi:hypothetical protein